MKIVNIYGQEMWHADAKILGKKEGLLELRDIIDRVIKDSEASNEGEGGEHGETALFASDGEGYTIIVECHNDEWGIAGGADSFWNKEESHPEYTNINSFYKDD